MLESFAISHYQCHLFERIYKRTGTSRPNELCAIWMLALILSVFLCVFMLRCHVSGVFMSCDCHGVPGDIYLSLYLVSCMCFKVVKEINKTEFFH